MEMLRIESKKGWYTNHVLLLNSPIDKFESELSLLEYTSTNPYDSINSCRTFLNRVRINKNNLKNTKIVIVGGTNGKGSCISYMDKILSGLGHSTLAYTSPHIFSYTERISINRKYIKKDEISDIYIEMLEYVRYLKYSYFGLFTMIMFYILNKIQPEYALLEIGLGGRLDPVNAIDNDISIISSLSLDHIIQLGNTVEKIGLEKSYIARKGKPIVLGFDNVPEKMIRNINDIGAILYTCSNGVKDTNVESCLIAMDLLGINISNITDRSVEIPYRIQHTIVDGCETIIDVSHNVASVELLKNDIKRSNSIHRKNTIAIFGAMSDKDIKGMVEVISEEIDIWNIIELKSIRSAKIDFIYNLLSNSNVNICRNIKHAYNTTMYIAGNNRENARLVVFGSFYIVSSFVTHINK